VSSDPENMRKKFKLLARNWHRVIENTYDIYYYYYYYYYYATDFEFIRVCQLKLKLQIIWKHTPDVLLKSTN